VKKKKRIIGGLIAVIMLVGLAIGGKYTLDLMYYKEAMSKVDISDVDLSKVKDGFYEGTYDARLVAATVRVTVKDGMMTDIRLLEHKYDRGGPAEVIVEEILNEQSLDVDAVSGATNSSRTLLKAVENALDSAPKE
jgi:uncharacterized protein with FMN-binding domain